MKVEVIEDATQEVVKSIECSSERDADRVAQGLMINLNHAEYSVRINKEA